MDFQQPQRLANDLTASIKLMSSSRHSDAEVLRKSILATAKSLVQSLEKPEEVAMWWVKTAHCERAALRIAVDLRIFHILCDANGPVTSRQLAEKTNAEELLIVRLMRLLCSFDFAKEACEKVYLATKYSKAMTEPGIEGGMKAISDSESVSHLSSYLKEKGYKCPTNIKDTTFQWAYKTKSTWFESLHECPESMSAFNDFMGVIRSTRKFWADWYDVQSRLIDGFKDGAFLVDIGGGKGHDTMKLLERFPHIEGSLVLQDLPGTIEHLPADFPERITPMSHDFFAEQPIKEQGARVYFVHLIFHDWPDHDCRKILKRIKEAMKPGYSKLVINEAILPAVGCASWFAAADFTMMTNFGAKERTASDWRTLVESVGLTVLDVQECPFDDDLEGIIEVVLENETS
ncbi:hydroxyindole O-methyltransferase [Pseudovirgaria hyperparasitica]|uniref:Hydroxyindole O-methyltransferase n=1 Tax=Pseudovirgaria hyperparasitica TaxID=470096 RepID=A0A6A6VZW0_9PEZI|nr:hydroxyindole O-methyltransferase [Pseudovirgaria hyperparasitica]KAF2755429.1 hydroxyindole O-methyltransferase [Pseudovirgaria hyperparasitica]